MLQRLFVCSNHSLGSCPARLLPSVGLKASPLPFYLSLLEGGDCCSVLQLVICPAQRCGGLKLGLSM